MHPSGQYPSEVFDFSNLQKDNGPLFGKEGIVSAEIDTRDIVRAKMDFDVIGHYARTDVFSFSWNKNPDKS